MNSRAKIGIAAIALAGSFLAGMYIGERRAELLHKPIEGWRPVQVLRNVPIYDGHCKGRTGDRVDFLSATGDTFAAIDCGLPSLVDQNGKSLHVDSILDYDWTTRRFREDLGNMNDDALKSITRTYDAVMDQMRWRLHGDAAHTDFLY